MPELPVIAEVSRSERVESRHRGSVVILDQDGDVDLALGDVRSPMYPRSTNKPLQVTGMLRAGLQLSGESLALAAASHGGHPIHRDGVRKILAGAGLDEAALRTPPALPLDPTMSEEYLRSGGSRQPLLSDCSGKHAAMIATCVTNGWPLEDYRHPEHPLQLVLRSTISALADEDVAHIAIDGCGAPIYSISLVGLARAYRALVRTPAGTPQWQVADAMRRYPEYVAGVGMTVTDLMRNVPGLLAKSGAEAVMAIALPDGRSAAVKVEDGGTRAVAPVTGAILRYLGASNPGVDRLVRTPVLGGGREVGETRACSLPPASRSN